MPRGDEWKAKLAEAARKRGTEHLRTPEVRAKIAAALTGKTIPEEVRRKQSETRKRLFAEGKLTSPTQGNHAPRLNRRGVANGASWKGGRWQDSHGYVWVKSWGHPMADKKGYVLEHRLVMSSFLGRALHPWESIHHRNAVRNDNRLENLLLVLTGKHQGRVSCPKCRFEFAIR